MLIPFAIVFVVVPVVVAGRFACPSVAWKGFAIRNTSAKYFNVWLLDKYPVERLT